MKLKGISYSRVSTDEQYKNKDGSVKIDSSPKSQREQCEAHIKNLSISRGQEMVLIEHLSDLGYSGKDTKRPNYQRMLKLISRGDIDFIVAKELSRISRSVTDFLELIDHCEKNKVAVIIIGLNLDTTNPGGKFIITLLAGMAQFEREMTSQRVRDNARTRLIKDGKINGANEILGLKSDPDRKGHYLPVKEELIIVEKVMRTFLKTSSKQKTLNEINAMGLQNRKGKPFTMNSLSKLLDNAEWRYRGLWYANKENKDVPPESLPELQRYQIVELPHGSVLPTDLLDKVTNKLAETYIHKKRSGKDHIYLLSHILKYEDGTSFRGESAKSGQHRYYRNKKHKIAIPIQTIDEMVVERVKRYLGKDQKLFQRLLTKAIKRNEERLPLIESRVSQLQDELASLNEREKGLQDKLLSDSSPSDILMGWLEKSVVEINSRRTEIQTQIETLRADQNKIADEIGLSDTLGKMKELISDFGKLTGTQKRTIIEQIFKEVVIKKDNVIELKIYTESPGGPRHNMEDRSLDRELNGRGSRTRTWDPPVMSRML